MAIKNNAGAVDLPTSTELALDRTHLAHERTPLAILIKPFGNPMRE
ncbi:MAG TPA: hypothetical protein VKG02_14060 [Blastocatellia bacterium]|nr:hypothetical protein [Blastocatellia bacterium]